MHNEIHEIVFHGNGGYTYWDVYEMPIAIRKFTYKKIEKFYKDKNDVIDEKNNVITNTTDISKLAKPPQSNNTYNAKVSK